MDLPPLGDIAIVVAGALAAGFVNGLSGTGYALIALGFWLHAMSPLTAAPLVALCSVGGHVQSLPSIWRGVRWPRLWPFLVAGIVGVPLGTLLLEHVRVQPLKVGVGVLLILYCCWMGFVRRPPIVNGGGRIADAGVGLVGGVLGGMASLSGPAPTIWVQLRGWNKNEQRGVNQPFNMAILSTALVSAAVGRIPRPHFPRVGYHLPARYLGGRAAWPPALWPRRRCRLPPHHSGTAGSVGSDVDRVVDRMKRGLAFLFLGFAIAMAGLALFMPGRTPNPNAGPRTVDNVAPSAPTGPSLSWPDYSVNSTGFQTPAMADGELIAYGYRLVSQTFAVIGPEVSDPAKRFAGNNLSCQNCHLDGGTNRTGLPLVGVFKTYPKFNERDKRVLSLPERLNDCMTRSMNGQPLPDDSREMKALVAFMRFIGEPAPVASPPAPLPPQPADAARGAVVFTTVCAACHQPNGLGQRMGSSSEARGYVFPPLWGPDSFNDGAGMDQPQRAAAFIRHNMPRGVDPQNLQLSLQQAWDVAAYLKTQPRPHDPAPR